jgi:hypothetical protein
MWPKRRVTFDEAREALWDFHDRMVWSRRIDACRRSNASLCWAVAACLQMMLGREPTREEVIEVLEEFAPFWSKERGRRSRHRG